MFGSYRKIQLSSQVIIRDNVFGPCQIVAEYLRNIPFSVTFGPVWAPLGQTSVEILMQNFPCSNFASLTDSDIIRTQSRRTICLFFYILFASWSEKSSKASIISRILTSFIESFVSFKHKRYWHAVIPASLSKHLKHSGGVLLNFSNT